MVEAKMAAGDHVPDANPSSTNLALSGASAVA